jgi:NADH-quinone oxidoreductase subunit H
VAGWASVSKYALLGCLRAAVQFIAFEAILGLVLLVAFAAYNSFNFEVCVDRQVYGALALSWPPLAILLLVAFFLETNRPPFDLSEAESDIVAGYNVEYAGFLFGLFYLSEYVNLFALCVLLVTVFAGGWRMVGAWSAFGLGMLNLDGWLG